LQEYPDFFDFTTTLSKNPTGVQSSVQAIENIKKYDGLVGELAKIDPKLVGLIVNDPSGYEFSQASYNYLYGKKVAPDSPEKFLSSQSPAESQKKKVWPYGRELICSACPKSFNNEINAIIRGA
jgi:hypothetical protein